MEINLYNYQGKTTGKTDLPQAIFESPVNKGFLHEVITAYRAGIRAGTASTKNRSEVAGGGRKPWKQKGTGRARAGSIRSPLWRKGGIIFGPKPRSYVQAISKRKIQSAICQALSDKIKSGDLIIIENLGIFASEDMPKTKKVIRMLRDLKMLGKKVLTVTDVLDEKYMRASRNIARQKIVEINQLHAYAILAADKLIMTKPAVSVLSRRYQV